MANIPEIFKTIPLLDLLHESAQEDKEADSTSFWQNFFPIHFPIREHYFHWEISPDKTQRRADGITKKYDPSHHTALPILYIESKRDVGNMGEVEEQARDAMSHAIDHLGLSGVHAVDDNRNQIPILVHGLQG